MTASSLTGQDAALSTIREWVGAKDVHPRLTLEGPSGSGKSWVVKEITRLLSGDRRVVLVAEGDPFNGNRQLLPLAIALSRAPRLRRLAKTAASEAGRGVPMAGSFIQFSVNMLLNYREIAQTHQTPFLPQAERELLIEIERRAEENDVLIVLENLHWWDGQSLDLLTLILTNKLDGVFPFLTRTKFLAVLTPDQNTTHPDKLAKIRQLLGGVTVKLEPCLEALFGQLLMALGARQLPDGDTLAALYRASRGHLAMAQRLAQRLDAPTATISSPAVSDIDALCRELLEERITLLGARGVKMASLLCQAAAIGLSFTDSEVRCLAKDLSPEISACLDDARRLDLLSSDSDRLVFSHEIIQRYFSQVSKERDPDVHRRFAECLQLLRPGDYRSRWHHHSLADQGDLASIARAHQALAERRTGVADRSSCVVGYGLQGSCGRFVKTMWEAWDHYDSGRYDAAIEVGKHIDETLPSSLLAERDCLMARCYVNGLTKDHWRAARNVLQRWAKAIDSEIEVWSRLMLTQIIVMYYDGDVDGAKSVAHELAAKLSPREKFDREASRTLTRLKLKADMLYVPEVAAAMICEALDLFGPRERQPDVSDPINYFVGLTNLSANQILNGSFQSAFATAQDGERFLAELQAKGQHYLFPRVDMLANNLIVAGFRAGILTAAAAAAAVGQAIASGPKSTDTTLLRSNQAVLITLDGRPAEALPILEEMTAVVSIAPDYDAYYTYFIFANLTGVQYALGSDQDARKSWGRATEALKRIEMPIRPYLDRRHAIQTACLDRNTPGTVSDWEDYISQFGNISEVGPGWQHFGRGYLLSDLQYWAED